MSRKIILGSDGSEAQCQRVYGCSVSEYLTIRGASTYRGSSVEKYVTQRRQARIRGIEWNFSLVGWWAVWQQSGLWDLRGFEGGYCMCRRGDAGPYSAENVYIGTISQNSRDGIAKAKPAIQRSYESRVRAGEIGRGWTKVRGGKNPYQVTLGKKYIGRFATEKEASDAYKSAVDKKYAEHGFQSEMR